jgi:hypothetical protein
MSAFVFGTEDKDTPKCIVLKKPCGKISQNKSGDQVYLPYNDHQKDQRKHL